MELHFSQQYLASKRIECLVEEHLYASVYAQQYAQIYYFHGLKSLPSQRLYNGFPIKISLCSIGSEVCNISLLNICAVFSKFVACNNSSIFV